MDAQKVDMFILINGKYFESFYLKRIRQRLLELDESKWPLLQTLQFKEPNFMLIVSFLGGTLGIDRFMIGDTGIGLGKLFTCGGIGIWAIIDLFLIMGSTREKNMSKLEYFLEDVTFQE